VYNFISSAKHTLDMTMYALSDPKGPRKYNSRNVALPCGRW
jgi:hypothetical protein